MAEGINDFFNRFFLASGTKCTDLQDTLLYFVFKMIPTQNMWTAKHQIIEDWINDTWRYM